MEKPLVKPASLLSLIQADLPPTPCWIDPILPKGGTLLFGGGAKIGKSFILLELARALALGVSPFDCTKMQVAEPVRVLFVEQELGQYGLQKRVKTIFENEDPKVYGDKLWYASKIPELQLDSHEGRSILFDLVDEVKPNVLLLDPIGRMNSYDENKSDQIQQLFNSLETLVKIFSEQDLSVVISHHFLKPPSEDSNRDPLDPYNFRGSSKWKDNPDSLITVQKLKFLDKPYKAWNLRMRFDTRQDEGLPDMLMSVNRDKDLRVRFEKMYDDQPVTLKQKSDKPVVAEIPRRQMRFAEG